MIGDVLTSSILFEVLRKEYPGAQLEYLINENTQAVVANNPNIDQIHSYLSGFDQNVRARKAFYYKLEATGYDLIIDVYAKLRSANLTRVLKPKRSVGYHKWYTSFCYKQTVKPATHTDKDEGLAITNRMLLLDAVGIVYKDIPKPKIYLTAAEKIQASELLSQNGIDRSTPLFMISTFGSSENKSYPVTYLAKVLDHLVEQTGGTLLLNYMPSQQNLVDSLMDQCKDHTQGNIRTDIYGSSLREFLALTSHCDAVIGNEGGAINMAKALNIHTFSIYSPWILKAAWNSYEASGDNASIHLNDVKPELYQKHPKKYKRQALSMYQELLPEFVIKKLDEFLNHHGFSGSKP